MMSNDEFFLDPSRCIGCQACVQACGECESHRGQPMIHLEYVHRSTGVQTAPVVCMHCEDPTCARVCPADAIKQDDHGVVHSAAKSRCIGCSNCVVACPFGVPKMKTEIDLMMKCDMCYDRTSVGKKPMCATVCPSGALYFGPRDYIVQNRREQPLNQFQFGRQTVRTKVNLMVGTAMPALSFEVLDYLPENEGELDPLDAIRPGAPDAAASAVWDDAALPSPCGGNCTCR